MKKTLEQIKNNLAMRYYYKNYQELCRIKQYRIDNIADSEFNKQDNKK